MTDDKRFYGIYEGVCVDNEDPDNLNKIKVQVPQILGEEITDWAKPCLPVIANANHPDHVSHTAAQVAALLSTSSAGSPSHTHTISGNSGTLSHPHKTSTDTLDTNTASPQHTYHRTIPNIGQKVWVMFIAGDPNFPVWMGVEI